MRSSLQSERGSILIVVALAGVVLFGLAAFVTDSGAMWFARRQAQNAADAGAMAGAIALVSDDPTWPIPAGGKAEDSATGAAQANTVLGIAPVVKVLSECPPFLSAPSDTNCVRVDVYRNGEFSSPTIPTYFANLFGISTQGVRATATAQVSAANASRCLKPWAIPDQWTENNGNTTFDPGVDVYAPPVPGPGTGYTANDKGDIVTLKPGSPKDVISPSEYFEITLNGDDDGKPGGGTKVYTDGIVGCSDTLKRISNFSAPLDVVESVVTLPGNRPTPTEKAVQDLIDQDSSAYWNSSEKAVWNDGGADAGSPRIALIAMFDPASFMAQDRTSGILTLEIVNIMAVFVQSVDKDGNVIGIIVDKGGELVDGGPAPGPGGAFLKTLVLVR